MYAVSEARFVCTMYRYIVQANLARSRFCAVLSHFQLLGLIKKFTPHINQIECQMSCSSGSFSSHLDDPYII